MEQQSNVRLMGADGSVQPASLANIKQYLPASKRVRDSPENLQWEEGLQLLQASKTIRLFVYSDWGQGKTFSFFSWLEDMVENQCNSVEHIQASFGHWGAEAVTEIMNGTEEERRTLLLDSTQCVFIDNDNRGFEKLAAGATCHPDIIANCIKYIGVQSFENLIQSIWEGMAFLKEHQEKGWSKYNCMVAVDNMEEMWSEAQNDYLMTSRGMTVIEYSNYIKAQHPGIDQDARNIQNAAKGSEMDWTHIKGQHKEILQPIFNSGYHVLFLAPTKEREKKVALIGGGTTKQKVEGPAGEKNLPFFFDWVLRKSAAPDGSYRQAEFLKCRYTGLVPQVVVNPTHENVRREMERLTLLHFQQKMQQHARVVYLEALPTVGNLNISQFVKGYDPKERVKVELASLKPLMGSLPTPVGSLPMPGVLPAVTPAPPALGLLPAAALPRPGLPPLPQLPAPTAPIPLPAPAMPPPLAVPAQQSKIDLTQEAMVNVLNVMPNGWEITALEGYLMTNYQVSEEEATGFINHMIDTNQAHEPSLGLIIPGAALVGIPLAPPAVPEEIQESVRTSFLINPADQGVGNYHVPGCQRIANLQTSEVSIISLGGRTMCEVCMPPQAPIPSNVALDPGTPNPGTSVEW